MASLQKSICVLMAFFITFISSTHAYTFQVGGKDGWTLHPSESYNSWSGRLRFLINDTLHFKYDGGLDSVLVVNKSDYDGCSDDNPIVRMDGGDSMYRLDRSGPFYFITGDKSNCDQGQKLVVVVLAVRNRSPPRSVATPPAPPTLPPSPVVSPVFPPSISPISPPSTPVSPVFSPVSPPSTAISPISPPLRSPELSPSGGPIMAPPSPGGESADSPDGESADSPGEGGGGQSPKANSPAGNMSTPPPGPSAAPLLSGSISASFVTIMVVLWGIN